MRAIASSGSCRAAPLNCRSGEPCRKTTRAGVLKGLGVAVTDARGRGRGRAASTGARKAEAELRERMVDAARARGAPVRASDEALDQRAAANRRCHRRGCPPARPARRIVSLVPGITEILFALGVGDAVPRCTLLTQPAQGVAAEARVGGRRTPALDAIRALGADLVIANVEENLREHVEALPGWASRCMATFRVRWATASDWCASSGSRARGRRRAAIAAALEADLARTLGARGAGPRPCVFCPIWRRPYMAVGDDTSPTTFSSVWAANNVFAAAPHAIRR